MVKQERAKALPVLERFRALRPPSNGLQTSTCDFSIEIGAAGMAQTEQPAQNPPRHNPDWKAADRPARRPEKTQSEIESPLT